MIHCSFSVPSITWMTILVVALVSGCNNASPVIESFESLSDGEQLPKNWELQVKEGTYKTAGSGEAREGSTGLAFGGAGGAARVVGPPIMVPAGSILMSTSWVKLKQCKDASVVVGFEQPEGEAIVTKQFPASIKVATDDEDWGQQTCALIPPVNDKASKARFFASVTGEGLLLLDDVRFTVHQIDTTYESPDTSFETPRPGGDYAGWNVSGDGIGEAIEQTKLPQDGVRSLRVHGDGKWAVATHEFPLRGEECNVLVHCFARAEKGSARVKIEYFLGDQHQGDSYSEVANHDDWQPLFAFGDWGKVSTCDSLRISLAVENPTGTDGCSADFDNFSMVVIKP